MTLATTYLQHPPTTNWRLVKQVEEYPNKPKPAELKKDDWFHIWQKLMCFGKFEVATLQDLELHKYCHNLEQLKVATTKHIAQLRSAESGPVKSEIEGGGRNPRFWTSLDWWLQQPIQSHNPSMFWGFWVFLLNLIVSYWVRFHFAWQLVFFPPTGRWCVLKLILLLWQIVELNWIEFWFCWLFTIVEQYLYCTRFRCGFQISVGRIMVLLAHGFIDFFAHSLTRSSLVTTSLKICSCGFVRDKVPPHWWLITINHHIHIYPL